jgi:hypothetical protein
LRPFRLRDAPLEIIADDLMFRRIRAVNFGNEFRQVATMAAQSRAASPLLKNPSTLDNQRNRPWHKKP